MMMDVIREGIWSLRSDFLTLLGCVFGVGLEFDAVCVFICVLVRTWGGERGKSGSL